MMGATLLASGDLTQSRSYIEKARTRFPQRPELQLQVATLEFKEQNFPVAIETVDRVLINYPQNAKIQLAALLLKGQILEKQENWPSANQVYTQASQSYPQSLESKVGLGRILIAQGDYETAIATLKPLIAVDPNDPDLYYNLGLALYKSDRQNEARSYLTKAAQLYGQRQQLEQQKQAEQLLQG